MEKVQIVCAQGKNYTLHIMGDDNNNQFAKSFLALVRSHDEICLPDNMAFRYLSEGSVELFDNMAAEVSIFSKAEVLSLIFSPELIIGTGKNYIPYARDSVINFYVIQVMGNNIYFREARNDSAYKFGESILWSSAVQKDDANFSLLLYKEVVEA